MGYNREKSQFLTIGFDDCNPVDSTAYAFMSAAHPLTAALQSFFTMPHNGIIKKVVLSMTCPINYSDEPWTISLYSGATSLGSFVMTKTGATSNRSYGELDLSASVTKSTGYLNFRTTTPAWATNPTDINGVGYIEYSIV
jgi:hypothetical protein